MKRFVGLAVVALLAAAPSHAETVPGHVEGAAMTPSIPRMLYLADEDLNGTMGFVTPIDAVDHERPFVLTNLGDRGETSAEDLDVWFYRDISGTGDVCARDAHAAIDGGETGTMCAGARWAVVVLFSGASTWFRLSY